jgi:hypothetical protein
LVFVQKNLNLNINIYFLKKYQPILNKICGNGF